MHWINQYRKRALIEFSNVISRTLEEKNGPFNISKHIEWNKTDEVVFARVLSEISTIP